MKIGENFKVVSVIIPTFNAKEYISILIERILQQTISVEEIIIIDSSSDDNTVSIAEKYEKVRVITIPKEEFNHGGTRHKAVLESRGDIICFLTQDALPTNEFYIENLTKLLSGDLKIACACGKQIANDSASESEKLSREFNYPNNNFTRTKSDIPKLGIKTFFFSNCCSAYRKDAYLELGGFENNIIVNEDMEITSRFLNAGYSILYVNNAVVLHSHNYSLLQNFRRNFDIAIFLKMHSQIDIGTDGEGAKLVMFTLKKMLSKGSFFASIYFIIECAFKLFGNKIGKHYNILPKFLAIKMSGQKNWWK